MTVKSNFKNMVICLTATCFLCSAVLGAVYAMTKESKRRTEDKLLKESIGKVLPGEGVISEVKTVKMGEKEFEYYESELDGKVIAYAVKTHEVGYGGPLTLMVGILPDGVIFNTSVLSHSETPGLGAKCETDEDFLLQFRKLNPDEKTLALKKDGGDIDAITASTITSRAYVGAVKTAAKVVAEIQKGK